MGPEGLRLSAQPSARICPQLFSLFSFFFLRFILADKDRSSPGGTVLEVGSISGVDVCSLSHHHSPLFLSCTGCSFTPEAGTCSPLSFFFSPFLPSSSLVVGGVKTHTHTVCLTCRSLCRAPPSRCDRYLAAHPTS